MAIGHLNVLVISRSKGKSSVDAAAYASRTDLVDERTGYTHHYGRNRDELVSSWVWLPKGAPDHLRDRATLWNAVERVENRVNSQLARRIILALPHELTEKQREMLLKDYVRENFTRKGLAADVNIHKPHVKGDQRNHHAHLLIPMRFFDKDGIGKKDRESNSKDSLQALRDDWEKKVNHALERYGHATRISMETLQAQGIDRTPQIHMGQGATALIRKGIESDRGDLLRSIANDNDQRHAVADDLQPVIEEQAEPEILDRDQQNAEWQESINAAGIAYEEEQRRQFLESQAAARDELKQQEEAMAARHAAAWTETLQRHASEGERGESIYQAPTGADVEQAVNTGVSFLLGLFTSWAESFTRSLTGSSKATTKRQRSPEKAKPDRMQQREAEQRKEAHSRELEAMLQEQARERENYERHRALMLFQQAGALQRFEEQVSEKSALKSTFEQKTERTISQPAEKDERQASREGRNRNGPELG